MLQTQWQWSGGMASRRTGIPRAAVEFEAQLREIELSEYFMDKFMVCENAVIQLDINELKASE